MFYLIFALRLFKNSLIFFALSLPLMLVGIIVLIPLVALGYEIGKLPVLFRWFDSADPFVGRNTEVIESVNTQGRKAIYNWLALRNPINYFNYKYLGFVWNNPEVKTYTSYAESFDITKPFPDIGDSTGDAPGFKYIEVKQDGKTYYEYYYIKKYNEKQCLRFRMGWKIGNPYQNNNGEIQQDVLVFQPLKSYSGI